MNNTIESHTSYMKNDLHNNGISSAIIDENLSIEVTTECNSRCSHCFARAGQKTKNSLNPETVRDIITEGYTAGYRMLHITGGEPLLWEHFTQTLDTAFNTGYTSVFCNTNGTLLDKKKCIELASYGESIKFSVSLQGNEELHDRIRGSGSWKRVTRGIMNALEAGLEIVIFTSTGRSLLADLPFFADSVFKDYPGIESLTLIQLIRVTDDEFDLSDELLTPEDFIKMVKTVSLLSLYGLKIDILENPLASVAASMLGMKWLPQAPPLHRNGRIVITADGNIALSHSARNYLGIYKPGKLKETLESAEYMKAVSPDNSACADCTYFAECRRYDMIRPSEWYRDMQPEVPYCVRVLDLIPRPLV